MKLKVFFIALSLGYALNCASAQDNTGEIRDNQSSKSATSEKLTAKEKRAAAKRAKAAKNSPNNTKVVGNSHYDAAELLYTTLMEESSSLQYEIDMLSLEKQSASNSKKKRIDKKIKAIERELATVNRKMESYPPHIKDPNYTEPTTKRDAFMAELDAKIESRIAEVDPFAGKISEDQELETVYREYLAEAGYQGVDGDPNKLVYRVMIAITREPIPQSSFEGMVNILEQKNPNGTYVYYQGEYSSVEMAEVACTKILADKKFRDSFVVAMRGTQRVPMK